MKGSEFMFTNPIVVYTTPFFSKGEEAMIIRPDSIIGFGIDKHKNMFVTAVDGSRYYIADNSEQTAAELCLYMYKDSQGFDNKKIRDMFSCTYNGKE